MIARTSVSVYRPCQPSIQLAQDSNSKRVLRDNASIEKHFRNHHNVPAGKVSRVHGLQKLPI